MGLLRSIDLPLSGSANSRGGARSDHGGSAPPSISHASSPVTSGGGREPLNSVPTQARAVQERPRVRRRARLRRVASRSRRQPTWLGRSSRNASRPPHPASSRPRSTVAALVPVPRRTDRLSRSRWLTRRRPRIHHRESRPGRHAAPGRTAIDLPPAVRGRLGQQAESSQVADGHAHHDHKPPAPIDLVRRAGPKAGDAVGHEANRARAPGRAVSLRRHLAMG